MIRDFKYIIKRIIIGTGIALALMFIKTNVFASEISPYGWGGVSYGISSGSSSFTYSISPLDNGVQPWYNHGNGILRFNVSINKSGGSATDPYPIPRTIVATSGVSRYVCSFGSTQWQNSTFVGVTYSVECPMNLQNNGVDSIIVAFNNTYNNLTQDGYLMVISSDASYEVFDSPNVNVNVNNNGTIQNDNQNTQSIINNQNSNTQSINDNINEQFNDCKPKKPIYVSTINNAYMYKVQNDLVLKLATSSTGQKVYIYEMPDSLSYDFSFASGQTIRIGSTNYLYNDTNFNGKLTDDILVNSNSINLNTAYSLSTSKKYLYIYVNSLTGTSDITVGFNGEICKNRLDTTNDNLQDINNTINNDNVDSSTGSDFFNNFQSDSHGLSGIITAPLRLVNALTTAQCSPLQFQLPFIHNQVSLPCMRSIYENYFGVFFTLYQLITTGLICYAVMINLYSKVHALQNPNNDRIEVLNL